MVQEHQQRLAAVEAEQHELEAEFAEESQRLQREMDSHRIFSQRSLLSQAALAEAEAQLEGAVSRPQVQTRLSLPVRKSICRSYRYHFLVIYL